MDRDVFVDGFVSDLQPLAGMVYDLVPPFVLAGGQLSEEHTAELRRLIHSICLVDFDGRVSQVPDRKNTARGMSFRLLDSIPASIDAAGYEPTAMDIDEADFAEQMARETTTTEDAD